MISFSKIETDDNSLLEYKELLNLVFPKTSFDLDYLKWLYNKNPFGTAIGYNAYSQGKLVAHYVTIPVIYFFKNIKFEGLLSLNTVTHPDFQGKGIFTNLANKTYEYATQLGYKFIIGVANNNSTYGFINKLGFRLISPLDVYLTISSKGKELSFDTKFTSIVNKDFINWRLSRPKNKYFSRGNVIFSKSHVPFLDILLSTKRYGILIPQRRTLFSVCLGLNNIPPTFFKLKIPSILKPSPLNLVFKPLSSELVNLSISEFFIEAIDFDAY